jgi:hypothetical protein
MATVTSTVPASAAGTEILRRAYIADLSSDADEKLIDGASNYTYTVLSVVFCDGSTTNTTELLNMWIMGGASQQLYLLRKAELPANGTYVFNDKIMLAETDELLVGVESAADIDVYCTYIEQRWA